MILTNHRSGEKIEVITNHRGEFTFRGLEPGEYTLQQFSPKAITTVRITLVQVRAM